MRKLFPNLENEDGLETILEVPIPEKTFLSGDGHHRRSKTLRTGVISWMKPLVEPPPPLVRAAQLQLMLRVIGAPLLPLPVRSHEYCSTVIGDMKNNPIDISMAKYILQQYISASGGEPALNGIESMYAIGKVRMTASEVHGKRTRRGSAGEVGGFVLWRKRPELWCLELVAGGCKFSAGSDGAVTWRQTPWSMSQDSRGPRRPLRRSLQGLDPMSTAGLFAGAVCLGERAVGGELCFVLRHDAETAAQRGHGGGVEIIRHTVWGSFSQRTGLLVQLEDTHLLRIKSSAAPAPAQENVYWETTMESIIEDYRNVDGVKIAHAGRTRVSLSRFGEGGVGQARTLMEETWSVEEVEFNIRGLTTECFLPPADIGEEKEGGGVAGGAVPVAPKTAFAPPFKVHPAEATSRTNKPWEFAAVESDESASTTSTEEEDAGR